MDINFVSYREMLEDVKQFVDKINFEIDIVIGVPRSGLMVATIISQMLNIPIGSLCNDIIKNAGNRISDKKTPIKNVLIVEDSINSGNSLNTIVNKVKNFNKDYNIYTGALYVKSDNKDIVDIYTRIVTPPRVFEWNMLNSITTTKSCVDIDGVLCKDPSVTEVKNSNLFIEHMKNVKPRIKNNKYKIGAIVSGRYERYRDITEMWLKKHNINYNELVLMKKERTLETMIEHKSSVFLKDSYVLFIESDKKIAKGINKLTKKQVICTDTMEMIK